MASIGVLPPNGNAAAAEISHTEVDMIRAVNEGSRWAPGDPWEGTSGGASSRAISRQDWCRRRESNPQALAGSRV